MTIAEQKTAHMRAVIGVAEGQPGSMFFSSPTRARFLIGRQEATLVNVGDVPRGTGILRRSPDWPWDRFSTVARDWEGVVAVLIGGGPSLMQEQVALVGRARAADAVRVIAVNDAYLWAPWADVLYAADSGWWAWSAGGTAKPLIGLTAAQTRDRFNAFPGERCSIQNTGMSITDPAVHLLRNKHFPNHGAGISLDPSALVTGRNSGYQALNLAILAGAKTIILIGFDGQKSVDGKTHFFGDHPIPEPDAAFQAYRAAFAAGERDIKAAGVRVINASPGSAIGFEKMALEDALYICAKLA